jgi:hypothetical protein
MELGDNRGNNEFFNNCRCSSQIDETWWANWDCSLLSAETVMAIIAELTRFVNILAICQRRINKLSNTAAVSTAAAGLGGRRRLSAMAARECIELEPRIAVAVARPLVTTARYGSLILVLIFFVVRILWEDIMSNPLANGQQNLGI